MTGPRGPLADLTVVELTSTFLGPYCAVLLAQLGARVVKVEPTAGRLLVQLELSCAWMASRWLVPP